MPKTTLLNVVGLTPRLLDRGMPRLHALRSRGGAAPIAAVLPAVTCPVQATYLTGSWPAEHGIVGYELWLKEYGIVSNMILHSPISFENDAGSLTKAGFTPEQFLNLPTLGTHLVSSGVKSHALQHRSIIRSGLSQMFF